MANQILGWRGQLDSDDRFFRMAGAFLGAGLFTVAESWFHLNFELKTILALGLLAGITAVMATDRWGARALGLQLAATWIAIALWHTYGS